MSIIFRKRMRGIPMTPQDRREPIALPMSLRSIFRTLMRRRIVRLVHRKNKGYRGAAIK